ncbi:MAG: hypothetical protein HFI72_07345 [Peptococcaceae bacterium]|jgi:hypothetical protein|nr:hypothetical protein [Peptococcaceae bacterium]
MEDKEMDFQRTVADFNRAVDEYTQFLRQRIEYWERNKKAAAFLSTSGQEKISLDVLDTAIIVFGGGMVALAAFMVMILR